MVIGLMVVDMHFPQAQSLKDKRQALHRIKDRVRAKHNVAVAEVDFQDKWQRSRIGLVTISNDRGLLDNTFNRIRTDIETMVQGDILAVDIQFF
jgi:uncharacterized protein YlxP (DUF503 family)